MVELLVGSSAPGRGGSGRRSRPTITPSATLVRGPPRRSPCRRAACRSGFEVEVGSAAAPAVARGGARPRTPRGLAADRRPRSTESPGDRGRHDRQLARLVASQRVAQAGRIGQARTAQVLAGLAAGRSRSAGLAFHPLRRVTTPRLATTVVVPSPGPAPVAGGAKVAVKRGELEVGPQRAVGLRRRRARAANRDQVRLGQAVSRAGPILSCTLTASWTRPGSGQGRSPLRGARGAGSRPGAEAQQPLDFLCCLATCVVEVLQPEAREMPPNKPDQTGREHEHPSLREHLDGRRWVGRVHPR